MNLFTASEVTDLVHIGALPMDKMASRIGQVEIMMEVVEFEILTRKSSECCLCSKLLFENAFYYKYDSMVCIKGTF